MSPCGSSVLAGVALASLYLLTAAAGAPSADLPALPEYSCKSVAVAPVVDGRLDDPCWQSAERAGGFARVRFGAVIPASTFWQGVRHNGWLYMGIQCVEPKPEGILRAVRTPDSARATKDDCVEVFLRPPDRAPDDYYHFAVSAHGVPYDGHRLDGAWDGPWRAAVWVGDGGWSAEMAFDLGSLAPGKRSGGSWGLQVARDRYATGIEWSAWSDTLNQGYHAWDRFGVLHLTE
ncbi:MAG: hypothetical protein HPY69_12655 [Armatimonadetes bacterium]|nr:hypothetical protein [Armatimonadota bacterium]